MTGLGYIVWDVNPDIFHVGALTVRWYGLLFAMAFLVGYKIMEYVYKTEGYDAREVDRLSLHMIIAVVVGARLGHVLFYQPDYFLKNPVEILEIWKGGLASHGAAIGILVAMFIYTRKGPIRSYMWILDRIILTVPIGGFFVRMGNLMNSEIYGHETTLPWGFKYVRDTQAPWFGLPLDKIPACHPTQIYEGGLYLLLFIFLFGLYRARYKNYKAKYTLIETKNEQGETVTKESNVPEFPTNPPLKPGTLFGLFLILLFGIRFFVEFFKQVQEPFELNLIRDYGLNLGQLLSIPFILVGIFILIRSMRLTGKETI